MGEAKGNDCCPMGLEFGPVRKTTTAWGQTGICWSLVRTNLSPLPTFLPSCHVWEDGHNANLRVRLNPVPTQQTVSSSSPPSQSPAVPQPLAVMPRMPGIPRGLFPCPDCATWHAWSLSSGCRLFTALKSSFRRRAMAEEDRRV